jgi:toxin ParE1/3/4
MPLRILLTDDAARDLSDIHAYIAANDSPQAAEHVLAGIEKAVENLRALPDRGRYPAELASLGIRDYREILFKPYRILYRIFEANVTIYLIADGRRDLQTLLTLRLMNPD